MVTKNFNFFILQTTLFVFLFASCDKKEDYAVESYFNEVEKNKLIESFLPYLSKLEQGVNYTNRFDTSNVAYFRENQKFQKFSLERYFIASDSSRYFLIWKNAPSLYEKKIAIGGKYKVDENGKIVNFEELFNTPKMKLEELKEKSYLLFDYMVINGNVNPFLGDFLLIEFPDGNCIYDKDSCRWILTNNKRWLGNPYSMK